MVRMNLQKILQLGYFWPTNNLPVVDLGYEIYQPTGLTEGPDNYYCFQNIRYSSAPTGDLRWKAPTPPQINRTAVQSNSDPNMCAQGAPTWQIKTSLQLNEYLTTGKIPYVSYDNLTTLVAAGSEDCLFLDVYTPKDIFDGTSGRDNLAPVLVWIHGGGFTAGSKSLFGSPQGLLNRGEQNNLDKAVYVAINYRLGAFGFLSSSSFQEEGGIPNAGLLDQRFALQWIQDNIHHFGGDKDRVTVMGESGGGGSIMHHLTAFGGSDHALFNQAILQSPAYFPFPSEKQMKKIFSTFLKYANATDLSEARNTPSDILLAANSDLIGQSKPYGFGALGPTLDGSFVQEEPRVQLNRGMFDHSVKIIVSQTSKEGLSLVPPVRTNAEYSALLGTIFNRANSSTIEQIVSELYPPVFDGSMGYKNNYERAAKTVGEALISCNTASLGQAFQSEAYAYIFDVSPGLHGQDIGYTFYTDGTKASNYTLIDTGPVNGSIAFVLQDWILSFVQTGTPKSDLSKPSKMPIYGSEARGFHMNSTTIDVVEGLIEREKCIWPTNF